MNKIGITYIKDLYMNWIGVFNPIDYLKELKSVNDNNPYTD